MPSPIELQNTAFVYPGQGSQAVGMASDLYAAAEETQDLFDLADRTLGYDLSKIILNGPEEKLRQTENTQPAILLVSIALHRSLAMKPSVVAGHSLGEYSALVAADAIDLADALTLVHKRGRYMQEAVPEGDGAMIAILGVDEERIRGAITEQGGDVDVANYNAPGNIVIAGERAATLAVAEIAGGKSRELAVSAPFHSRLMQPAADRLAADLDAIEIRDPAVPLFNNVDAAKITTAGEVRSGLKEQVTRSVQWTKSVENMSKAGITHYVEIGPGKVLTGLIRRIERGATRHNVFDLTSRDALSEALQQAAE